MLRIPDMDDIRLDTRNERTDHYGEGHGTSASRVDWIIHTGDQIRAERLLARVG
jgi:hypothetical protein